MTVLCRRACQVPGLTPQYCARSSACPGPAVRLCSPDWNVTTLRSTSWGEASSQGPSPSVPCFGEADHASSRVIAAFSLCSASAVVRVTPTS
jgi:hypothetical protein